MRDSRNFDEGSLISFDFWPLNWLALVVSPRRISPRRRSNLWWLRPWLHARQEHASFRPACYTFDQPNLSSEPVDLVSAINRSVRRRNRINPADHQGNKQNQNRSAGCP